MPYNEGLLNTYSAPAGVDMSGKQFYAVSLVPDATGNPPGVKLALSVAAKATAGILQNNPLTGQAGCYQNTGISKVAISASQVITAGTTMLEVDAAGTLKVFGTGTIVAEALETIASTPSIMIISARLLPSNAADV
jgi:hypothetical protein